MSNSTKLAMSTKEEREIKVQIVSNFCRRANNSDYSLEDILAIDDDRLDLCITINNLDAESDAKVLEAVQYRPKHPRSVNRTHDESSGASFVPSDCGAPYYTDRAAQLCSVCNSSAAPNCN